MEVRYQLCSIIQQFVYLGIQLSDVQVCTEKEAKDNEKIRKFEHNIENHKNAIASAIERVNALPDDKKGYRKQILEKLQNIQTYIAETQNNELKIAVAASKKSGKSVIVNSMIECEIAPTSLELATPNNCIYKKSYDDEYHLIYKKKRYTSDDPEVVRSALNKIFKEAGKDYENGLGIPDMELFYPTEQNSFSSYTIYDTPGPDLAGAKGHSEAAYRAIEEADVLIFTIDYSKYLTDSEYNYLIDTWKLCQKKGKNYSLILNVNKLDLRYDDSGDKCIVRIVDFIRNKLINTGKKSGIDFRNCVVIGTSALTYFNAVAAPALKCPNKDGDCRCLESDFSDYQLMDCIDNYDDSDELSAEYEKRAISMLQQLRGMLDNAKVWHKQKITSLDEMKKFSGTPNLLAYVDYIATQKARNEKVNNLMFKISSESAAINNLFHIEELIQRLSENKAMLAKAREILAKFQADIKEILDHDYYDLFRDNYTKIYNEYEIMRSEYLLDLTQKYPIRLNEITGLFKEKVEQLLGMDDVLDEVTLKRIPSLLERRIKNDFGTNENDTLSIDSVAVSYEKYISEISRVSMSKYVDERRDEMVQNLETEQNGISKTLEYIWEQRLEKIQEVIDERSAELEAECSEKLEIELPVFQTVIGKKSSGEGINLNDLDTNSINRIIEDGMSKYNKFNDGTTYGIIGFFRRLFGTQNKILLKRVVELYNNEKIGYDLQAVYKKNGNLEEYLKSGLRDPMISDMNDYIHGVENDTKQLNDNIESSTKQIKDSMDECEKYEKTVEELEAEKNALIHLKESVQVFNDNWKEVVNL